MRTKLAALAAMAAISLAGVGPTLADGMPKGARGPAPMMAPGCAASKFAGFYAGVNGGMGSLTSTLTDRDGASNFPFVPFGSTSTFQHTEDGFSFGGQLGYNWVQCSTFFGVEADFSWADFDSSTGYGQQLPFFPSGATVSHSIDWLASIRTRAGIAIGDMLIYATGGFAFADISTQYTNNGFIPGAFAFSSSGTRTGWVAGFGTEYAWTNNIRITGDLLYYDFGTETTNVTSIFAPGSNFRFDDHHSLWVSRIGLNFALGGH